MASSKDFSEFQSPDEASVDRLVQALDRAYHRPGLMMWRSFLHGVMTGMGAAVGTALIGILSVYIFQVLGGPSLFKDFVNNLGTQIHQSITGQSDSTK